MYWARTCVQFLAFIRCVKLWEVGTEVDAKGAPLGVDNRQSQHGDSDQLVYVLPDGHSKVGGHVGTLKFSRSDVGQWHHSHITTRVSDVTRIHAFSEAPLLVSASVVCVPTNGRFVVRLQRKSTAHFMYAGCSAQPLSCWHEYLHQRGRSVDRTQSLHATSTDGHAVNATRLPHSRTDPLVPGI